MSEFSVQQLLEQAVRHHQSGQLRQAETLYRRILSRQPDQFDALHLLGVLAQQAGRNDLAIDLIRKAIAVYPNSPEAYSNLGNALKENGQIEEAVSACRRAILLRPDFAQAHNNLGNALLEQNQVEEGIAACEKAISLQPDFAEAYNNLGNGLRSKGRLDESIAAYRRAMALRPDSAEAYNNLGGALSDKKQFDEAIAAYRSALQLNPALAHGWNNLGTCLKEIGELEEAIAAFRRAVALAPADAAMGSNLLYALHFQEQADGPMLASEHQRWNQTYAEPLRRHHVPHANDRSVNRRLKIGYVSPDFRRHPVGRFIEPLLAHHDHTQYEIFAYSDVTKPDALTPVLRTHVDHWRDIAGFSNDRAAQQIRDDGIDILVDLTMHMGGNRLLVFARKPAPIQLTYLAYCSTTGLAAMDYRFSDPFLDPSMEGRNYGEKTWLLPETYWCYSPMESPPVTPLPALKKGHVTFGSLNNFCKLSGRTLVTWAHVLREVPGSRLLLHAPEGAARRRIISVFEGLGVAAERLQLEGGRPFAEYLRLYENMDIALDPFPYGGGTTTCDALWMGVPVITLAGEAAVSRGGLSILSNLQLPDLAAHDAEQYIKIVQHLSGDLPRLSELRSTLRGRMERSVLMDGAGFARNVEAAYRRMWREFCETAPP